MKNIELYKQFFRHRNINVGFEIECYYRGEKIDFNGVMKTLSEINPRIEIGGDGSLRPDSENDYAIEIKTPVLPAHKSILVLKSVFDWLEKFGYTNDYAGLHLNFSPKDNKQYSRFNPILFSHHPIWGEAGKYFKRNENKYCYNRFSNLKNIRSVSESVTLAGQLNDKYSAISLRNWHNVRQSDSRIEVRLFGGKNYEKEFDKISFFTDKIFNLFKKSSRLDLPIYKL